MASVLRGLRHFSTPRPAFPGLGLALYAANLLGDRESARALDVVLDRVRDVAVDRARRHVRNCDPDDGPPVTLRAAGWLHFEQVLPGQDACREQREAGHYICPGRVVR